MQGLFGGGAQDKGPTQSEMDAQKALDDQKKSDAAIAAQDAFATAHGQRGRAALMGGANITGLAGLSLLGN